MTLKERRDHLSARFAAKCAKSEKSRHMFPLNGLNVFNTRHHEAYFVTPARTKRLANSAIPTMQRILNSWHAIGCYSIYKCKPWIVINCIMDNKPLSLSLSLSHISISQYLNISISLYLYISISLLMMLREKKPGRKSERREREKKEKETLHREPRRFHYILV